MSDTRASSMRRDILSAYAVTVARLASWVLVSGAVYRTLGANALGLLTLVRATVGILSYTSLGLGPAMVKVLGDAERPRSGNPIPVAALASDSQETAETVLGYAAGNYALVPNDQVIRIYVSGERLAMLLGAFGILLAAIFSMLIWLVPGMNRFSAEQARSLVVCFGCGTVCRLISDAPSGLLQAKNRIALDNTLLAATEAGWGVLSILSLWHRQSLLEWVGVSFLLVNLFLLGARGFAARMQVHALTDKKHLPDWQIARQIVSLGAVIVLAQAADFLYAPMDCLLITALLGQDFVAYYSPALQIDAGLLLLVSGLSTVLYPKSVLAHAAGNSTQLRKYYIRGTLASALLLALAGAAVWTASGPIFQLWFNDPMTRTRAILPLLLIHTVIGGSSAVGRSVLLAMGKAKPFTASVLIAGVSNVLMSYLFVRYTNLGLKGIVLGTIIAVVGRCLFWMPFYVRKTLRQAEAML
jgi:O-antigen/teichoic acid export membrane protein